MAKYGNREYDVRISEKVTLTIFEAMAYTGLGMSTLYRLSEEPGCDFILYVGSRKAFKRKKLEEFIESHFSI
jgi:hypothetical protein